MNMITALLIGTALLVVILAILIILWAMSPPRAKAIPRKLSRDVHSIKKEIEHEAEEESKEELFPFNRPPRLTRPSNRKRL